MAGHVRTRDGVILVVQSCGHRLLHFSEAGVFRYSSVLPEHGLPELDSLGRVVLNRTTASAFPPGYSFTEQLGGNSRRRLGLKLFPVPGYGYALYVADDRGVAISGRALLTISTGGLFYLCRGIVDDGDFRLTDGSLRIVE